MTSMENLLFHYNKMDETDSGKSILRLILSHLSQLKDMSIYRLAEACYTSPSTISRLVKALGYPSYAEFRTSISTFVRQYELHNRLYGERRTLEQSTVDIITESLDAVRASFLEDVQADTLDAIADGMHAAGSVQIFGYSAMFMENTMQHDLVISGKPCDIILGDALQLQRAAQLTGDDFALFLCPAPIDSIIPQRTAVETAAATGATICVISCSDREAFLPHAHYVISCRRQHYMVDTFFLETVVSALTVHYRRKYIGSAFQS